MMSVFLPSMFIDFNAFFASVEQQLRPELRGKPIVVTPVMAKTTCCIAASQEAKPFGIQTGTPVGEAKRACPGLQIVEARPEWYVRFHRKLLKVVTQCGLAPEVRSIDEVHCKLWGEWMEVAAARRLAETIKSAIAEKIGAQMTCSIGIAPNEFLAKTASDMQKPNGLVVIEPDDLPACLFGLELRDLCGIGRNMEARLHTHLIGSVRELCRASKGTLRAVWGGIEGERFYNALHGLPTQSRETERRSVGHSHVLPPELRTEQGALSVLHRLTQKAATRLRSMEHVAAGMSVFVECAGQRTGWEAQIRFNPTQDTLEFLEALKLLWAQRPWGSSAVPMTVGVTFFHLCQEANASLPLFDRPRHERHRALLKAVDTINLKRGKNSIYFAGAHGALDYTPMRIAFNRIPDPETER